MKKVKFLFLTSEDAPFEGQSLFTFRKLPEVYEKRIIIFKSTYGENPALINNKLAISIVSRLLQFYRQLCALVLCREWLSIKKRDKSLYSYYQNEFLPDISDWILKKLNGYKPNVIVIGWTPNFLTAKTIRRLHEKTGAWIHFSFIDEQHMTGGCHYPAGCEGFKDACLNCPALKSAKNFSHFQLEHKKKYLLGLPMSISATPYDAKLALQSSLFHDAVIYSNLKKPVVQSYEKHFCREKYGINQDAFVVFFGCNDIYCIRKGFSLAIKTMRRFCQKTDNVKFLVAGNYNDKERKFLDGIDAVFTGFLSKDKLFMAYCASDCYLNTTLADSGPQMVNYAIALGIPVVSFPVGSADSLVKTGQTGYVAKYGDVGDLTKGLIYIHTLDEMQLDNMKNCCTHAFDSMKSVSWTECLAENIRNKHLRDNQ